MKLENRVVEEGYRHALQQLLKRSLVVDLVIVLAALVFWLLKRSLTVYDFGNALSTIGLFAVALGCLSLAFSWELKEPAHRRSQPSDIQNPVVRWFIDLAEANLFVFTMGLSGILAVGVGWLVAAIWI